MIPAISYCRWSTDAQDLSGDAQRAAIDRWAQANGVVIVSTYEDAGCSGATPIEDRPGLLSAVEAIKTHKAAYLIIAKRDRLARDTVVAAVIERFVERAGAKIVGADGVGNGSTPEAALMRGLMDLLAAYERALIRSRTKSALAVKKARGERLGGAIPFGFSCPDGTHLVENASEQATVARMRDLRASGLSLRAIGAALLAEGRHPRCGKAWFASTIAGILAAEKFSVPVGMVVESRAQ